ncbi:hypothetical protein D5F11_021480 [Siminovitchia terrae]|uniref:Uncharacterized protein n=1 Tax=Siminovitchia terrae TaxID=1914933 RepID=A0A429X2Q0_SIMTE|nr:hypothetical protein [Siminovitchia terrae]RST57635.1 hypothetical protein D5F11_021480 [Siminovitchia terrae]
MNLRQEVENPMVLDSHWNDTVKVSGTDALGNEIHARDEVFEYDDKTFVIEELSYDAQKVLELLGAERKYA